jgi:magnesium transporter
MIEIYKKTIKDFRLKKIPKMEKGSWISVTNPTQEDIEYLVKRLNLDPAILEDALDENEISRIEGKYENFYMIMRFPTENEVGVDTIPLLIVFLKENIVTFCKLKNKIIDNFIEGKNIFYTTQKTNFLLKIILEVFNSYDIHLNRILKDIKLKKIRIDNLKNKDILFLVQEEETLNNFVSSIVPIINILEKILSGRYVTIYEKDRDTVEDLVMDSKQTLELSKVGVKSIKNIREAYSTILTNDLNKVIKILTAVTIVLTIPTIISSIYGMNVTLPLASNPLAFFYIVVLIILMSGLLLFFLVRKGWL